MSKDPPMVEKVILKYLTPKFFTDKFVINLWRSI